MSLNFNNLERWQKIGAFIVTLVAIWNFIPTGIKTGITPMTVRAHETDNQFAERAIVLSSIHYYEWKLCDKDTGLINGKSRSIERQGFLDDAYDKFLELEAKDYGLRTMDQVTKCRALKDDNL